MQIDFLGFFLFLSAESIIYAEDDDCKWRENITHIDELAHHKYQILEDCIFYKLTDDADKMQETANALAFFPPSKFVNDILNVEVLNVVIRRMWMNEIWKEMHVNGYLTLSWKDDRLRWDRKDWKTDILNIRSYGRLWVPDINSDKLVESWTRRPKLFHLLSHQTSVQSRDYTTYQHIRVENTGNVTARLEFRIQAHCQIDYTDYPDDKQHCCLTLKSHLYPHYIHYFLTRGENVDYKRLKTNWHVKNATLKKLQDEDDHKMETLRMCISSVRKSSTLRIELTIPMVMSAILILMSPLFGNLQRQLYVKLFIILLQFICFQYLIIRTPQLGFGDTVPKIYSFYEFSLTVSCVSLLLTLFVSVATRNKHAFPPSHRMTLLATAFNSRLCCISEFDDSDGDTVADDKKGYKEEWANVFYSINNGLGLLLGFVYLLGIVVIFV